MLTLQHAVLHAFQKVAEQVKSSEYAVADLSWVELIISSEVEITASLHQNNSERVRLQEKGDFRE